MSECLVSGIVEDLTGKIVVNANLRFTRTADIFAYDGTVRQPSPVTARTNRAGFVSVRLVPGGYNVSIQTGGTPNAFDIIVPEAATANLVDIITPTPEEVSTIEELVAEATSSAAAAVEARGVAVAAAASVELNPIAFGAYGDGVSRTLASLGFGTLTAAQAVYPQANALTDEADLCAIRAAVAAIDAAGGGRITGGGTYRINRSIDTCSNLTLSLRLRPTSALGRSPLIRTTSAQTNIRLVGCRADNSDNAYSYTTDNFPAFYEASADTVTGLVVENCELFGFNTGVFLRGGQKRARIAHNAIFGSRRAGIFVYDPAGTVIDGNVVDCVLSPGTEWNRASGFSAPATGTGTRGGVGIWVLGSDDSLTDGQACVVSNNIVAHTHFEGIIGRGRGMTITGNQVWRANNSTLGATYGLIVEGTDGASDELGANDLIVANNLVMFCDGGIALREDPANTSQAPSRALVEGNTIYGLAGAHGIQVSMSNDTATDVVVRGNVIDGAGGGSASLSGVSIGRVNGCVVADNVIRNCAQDGVNSYRAETTGLEIRGNVIRNMGRNGIQVSAHSASDTVQILGNSIENINTLASAVAFNYVAIAVGSTVIANIRDNDIRDASAANMQNGIRAGNASCYIGSNRIVGATVSPYLSTNRPIMPEVETLFGKATLDFPSIPAGTRAFLSVTVNNAVLGDTVEAVSWDISQPDIVLTGVITSTGNVRVYAENTSGASIDPASATVRVIVRRTSQL